MTHPLARPARRALPACALVLAFALGAGACGQQGGDDGRSARASADPAPVASGTGPYPTPSDPTGAGSEPGTSASATPAAPSGSPVGTPKGGVPRAADVTRTDADAVGSGALKALWTFDTAVDSAPRAADVRAADAGWLTREYATQLRSRQGESISDTQWRQWTDHRAYTTVALSAADDAARPADTGTEAWRQWIVTTTPHGRDHWRGEPAAIAAFVRLTRAAPGKAWQVAGVQLQ